MDEQQLTNFVKGTFNKENLEDSNNNDKLEEKKVKTKVLSTDKIKDLMIMLAKISHKEPEAADVLYDIIKHVHGTYSDKYQSDVTDWLDTKALLLSKDGKFACIHNALKYLQRYSTTGFEKSENPIDLLKAIHYILFELQRSIIHNPKK